MKSEWSKLHKLFVQLREITSTDKSSSYTLIVTWDMESNIYVELGTYEIGDWARHTCLGPFKNEY